MEKDFDIHNVIIACVYLIIYLHLLIFVYLPMTYPHVVAGRWVSGVLVLPSVPVWSLCVITRQSGRWDGEG